MLLTQAFWIDAIGWIGAVSVIYAYLMVSIGKMKAETILYQALNMIGALCLIVNTFYKGAYPSTVVNIIWILIAIYALHRNGQLSVKMVKKHVAK